MSIQALNIALSSLRVSQQALNVTSNNIANAGVEGYTRKTLPQTTVVGEGGTYFGVASGNIGRDMDVSLRRDFWAQASRTGQLQTQESYLQRVQTFHGASDEENAISAEVSRLREAFTELASSPDDAFLQSNVVNQARQTANKFNDFGALLTNLRNDAQNEMNAVVNSANELLENIASLNQAIQRATNLNRTTADLEDERDNAVGALAEIMTISQYTRGDGVMVVQTRGGSVLVEDTARQLSFTPVTLGTTSTGADIFIDNPVTGVNLSNTDIGGQLGALVELRDETLPQYQAQADEFAHKLALRFDAQGMRLFTNTAGEVPGVNVADYTGFSSNIQVNPDFIADNALTRDGTEASVTVGEASSDIIRKVLDFTFGPAESVTATGTADLLAAPDLFTALGINGNAQLAGGEDVAAIGALTSNADLNTGDTFTIAIGGAPAVNIAIGAVDDINNLVANINGALNPDLTATVGPNGEVLLEANGDIDINLGTMSLAGLNALGFDVAVTPAENPSFTVQTSIGNPATITIGPASTAATLLADLNAINGVTATLGAGNELIIDTDFGGDLSLTNVIGNPITTMGMAFTQNIHIAQSSTNLGANGDLSAGITATDFIEEYGRRMITAQADDYSDAARSLDLEGDYRDVLRKQLDDNFGVDLDQETANLIQIQTNYSAAARVVSVAEELFDELLAAFR